MAGRVRCDMGHHSMFYYVHHVHHVHCGPRALAGVPGAQVKRLDRGILSYCYSPNRNHPFPLGSASALSSARLPSITIWAGRLGASFTAPNNICA